MAPTPVERLAEKLEAPALDDRSYRVIRLPNKLEALLVHDAETDKASASVSVDAGSFSDADDMPGMAHAVEHLLFMGTKKYPKENDYNQYLTAHSGYSNAYTASTQTNYYFEVSSTAHSSTNGAVNGHSLSPLHGALDRFAQFFISPLFLASTLDRELKAVDSENKKNLQSDGWRLRQLDHTLSNPKHPYHHFSTGNLETLRDEPRKRGLDIRKEFMDFHDKHYSANRMKLVVLGKESLDELEGWVGSMFAAVENKSLAQNRWDGPQPYTKDHLETTIFAKPVMDSRSVEINFPFLDEEELYETQPGRYISHLIGHEGPGSILAYLKAKGLANGLAAGASTVCPGTAFFHISVRLTEDGLDRYKDVVAIIFQYIAMLNEAPPQEWIMDEVKNMAAVDFKFREKTPASSFASRMSSVMQKPLPREWLLSGSDLIRKFDSKVISEALSYLRSDNFRLTIISQNTPGDWNKREKWYGTEYRVEDFDQEFKDALKTAAKANRTEELHLPHRNEFIPTNLDVEKREVADPAKAPKLIRNDELIRTWWKKDDTFWVPKAAMTVNLRNSLTNATPACMVKSRMFCELVKDALVEYSYDAEISGLEYNLSAYPVGLGIDISGYNDKMPVLLQKVLENMRDLEIKPERFAIMKERLLRGFKNWDYQQPFRQIGEYTGWLITAQGWIVEQYIPELQNLTIEELSSFFPQLLRQMHAEVFCHGNLYKEDALKMSDTVVSVFRHRPLPPAQWLTKRNMLIPSGSDYTYKRKLGDAANVNNTIEYYLAVGAATDRDLQAKVLLLAQLTDELGFDQLRTKEQLGYVVFTGSKFNATTLGYRIIIQSERSTEYLEDRINAFLAFFAKQLQDMSPEVFESHKASLINKRLEKVKNLGQETSRLWGFISSQYYDFHQRERQCDHIRPLSKPDMIDFFNHYIDPGSEHRAKLSIHLQAQVSPKSLAGSLSPQEQIEKVAAVLSKFSVSVGLRVAPEKLGHSLEKIDLASCRKSEILQAYERCIIDEEAASDDQRREVLGEADKLLDAILPSLGIEAKPEPNGNDSESELPPVPHVKETTIVNDVLQYKSGLQLSKAASPITSLSDFEELDSKL